MAQIFRFPQNTTLDTGSASFLLSSSVTNSPHSAHCTPRTHVNPPLPWLLFLSTPKPRLLRSVGYTGDSHGVPTGGLRAQGLLPGLGRGESTETIETNTNVHPSCGLCSCCTPRPGSLSPRAAAHLDSHRHCLPWHRSCSSFSVP